MSGGVMKFVPLFESGRVAAEGAKPVSFACAHFKTGAMPVELRRTGERQLFSMYGRQIEVDMTEITEAGAELATYEHRIEFDDAMLALLMRKYEERMSR